MPHVRQKDIAKILNVSRITVSKALRDAPDISTKMKKKVRKVADELGYIPHHHARTLHMNQTNTIGVVVPDVSNSFFSYVIHGIMDSAEKNGYHIILTVSREDPEIEQENIRTLLSMRVDGLLIAISRETVECEIFDTIKKFKTPMVFFDRTIEGIGFSSVGIDDFSAARNLIDYVIKSGYTKIAHLAGNQKIAIGRNRRAGFLEALRLNNISPKEDWIIEGDFERASGYKNTKKLLQDKERPEVIFTANDHIAFGAYKAIREAGLKIPEDIGIVAFGHAEFAEVISPTLTITDCPPVVLGRKAMDLLCSEIKDKEVARAQRVLLETRIIINESLKIK